MYTCSRRELDLASGQRLLRLLGKWRCPAWRSAYHLRADGGANDSLKRKLFIVVLEGPGRTVYTLCREAPQALPSELYEPFALWARSSKDSSWSSLYLWTMFGGTRESLASQWITVDRALVLRAAKVCSFGEKGASCLVPEQSCIRAQP